MALLSVFPGSRLFPLRSPSTVDRHPPPLCDCSIMCAMPLCFVPSKDAMVTSVMETITNPRLSSEIFFLGLTTCLRHAHYLSLWQTIYK